MRLIDADALHDDLVDSYMTLHKFYETAQDEQMIKNVTAQLVAFAEFAMRVKDAPTIDAEPVRHGYWSEHPDESCSLFNGWECSECKQIVSGGRGNYCPNCGAKMDGGAE